MVNILGKCTQIKILTVQLALEYLVWSRMTLRLVLEASEFIPNPLWNLTKKTMGVGDTISRNDLIWTF